MPSVAVKLYSVFFKFLLKHRLQNRFQNTADDSVNGGLHNDFGVTTRPDESVVAANPVFTDGVATKDIHIDPSTSLSVRIFLPETALSSEPRSKTRVSNRRVDAIVEDSGSNLHRRNSFGPSSVDLGNGDNSQRRSSYGNVGVENGGYRGYLPSIEHSKGDKLRKLPVMLQFHGGGFVSGSSDSVANDFFCRRIAKYCDVIVLAVGYRLAPENRYPAAFEDGWKKSDVLRQTVADTFGASMVEPWLAAHADPSRCVLLGVSCGANISDYVARKAVESGKLLDPVKVVAQVLMYPFFIGSVPTHSEIKLANSYFYDKPMCVLAWKLFLPENEFSLDHPAANPLIPNRGPPLKLMPPTLTVVAEHDWMRDRAIAYSEELRRVNVDAPVLEYKDAVHEFATLDMLLKTPQAQACAEDIAIWVKKYISIRGHEFSY
uniref:Alpha/beta hydrolase fold-3 domain-containing protein n=1 Tax=Chenopodium quinoa TaxID=63459 RepID=A0A803N5V2_CHEQI